MHQQSLRLRRIRAHEFDRGLGEILGLVLGEKDCSVVRAAQMTPQSKAAVDDLVLPCRPGGAECCGFRFSAHPSDIRSGHRLDSTFISLILIHWLRAISANRPSDGRDQIKLNVVKAPRVYNEPICYAPEWIQQCAGFVRVFFRFITSCDIKQSGFHSINCSCMLETRFDASVQRLPSGTGQ
ncbi:hypothetical protein [Peristeroidobacter soli]|uniref:hypothetical protein n=1 Tax=Peristeroidobacter soli TaxID=2497877 RepID=UPI001FE5803E|nr:hypothetical protein [Peristeroidobacter soli]